jgi:quinol monooxygenase YgiN
VIEGPIYSVTYVEVLPTSRADSIALLRRYREATRQEDGNLRCELVSRIGQPHQLVVLEVWRDQKAFEAHGTSPSTVSTRERLHAIRGAPIDERVHVAVAPGPLQPGPAGDAVYVVTHVDVIPPRKDDGLMAVKRLADASRPSPGNVRFEVVQQTSRPNHFTVIEIWKDARAVETHAMAEGTRRFRDALGPMSGALYDERMFQAVD